MTETVNLMDIYEELKRIEKSMITKEEMNRFIETVEVMANKDTIKQIKKSENDIVAGKVKEVRSTDDI